ncbi:MAG: phosphotransferase [Firmicutes bacterium]|nr:phosphotransferase [Bacillota bacterium]
MITDLLLKLNQAYGIRARGFKPFGPIWRVSSEKGDYALKKAGGPAEKLLRNYRILSRIEQAGFKSLILPEISRCNLPYFEYKDQYYQLFKWRHGEHPAFTDRDSVARIARLFADLHRFSLSMITPEDLKSPGLITVLHQWAIFLENLPSRLKNNRCLNRIDRALLRWNEYFLNQAHYSLAGLSHADPGSNPNGLIGFCHNDPAPRNIIIENGQYFLIDFELSGPDLLVAELAKLAARVLQANDWERSLFELVVEAYRQVRNISEWESAVLPYLLCFPSQFWRICSQRFEEKLKWSERRFAVKLWKNIDAERRRFIFLRSILPRLPDFRKP